MAGQNSEVYQIWAMRITLATTLIVVVLSWINAVKILDLIIRAGVSFAVMYLLMAGSLSLFETMAPPELEIETETEQLNSGIARGGVIDFSVGEDELQGSRVQDLGFPGQVDPNLSAGLPGSKQQAEIVRRMGWDDENK